MAILEEHFVGFDPTQGAPQLAHCPYIDGPFTAVWYERWTFTGWSRGDTSDTGIDYTHSFIVFDIMGQALPSNAGCGLVKGGFTGNETCKPPFKCPEPEEWLQRARQAVAHLNLPPPGTIQPCPGNRVRLGVGGNI